MKKEEKILYRLWHSDRLLISLLFLIGACVVSFTAFRIFYVQQKLFAAVAAAIGALALSVLVYYWLKRHYGSRAAFARTIRNQKTVLLSALCASGIVFFIFCVYSLAPLGDYTVLKMDLYHQYGPLFAELYDKVAAGKSLFYSWNSAGGSAFLGNYFNYLSSPFTLIIFWFRKENVITNAITFIIFAKCIASCATFSYYLQKHAKTQQLLSVPFSLLYAFSAYFIAYYWNVMWLDAVVALPLLLLGIEHIIEKSNAKLYIVSLVYVFLTNYYMAYMLCIFSVVYFCAYYFANYAIGALYVPKTHDLPRFSKIRQSRLLCAGARFAFASLLSAALCAVALLPIYKILTTSSATGDSFPADTKIYFDILDFLSAHLAALHPTIRSSGGDVTPNIYCGIISVIMLPLYLMNKRFSWKDKLVTLALLIGIFLVCNNNYTNFILHGFHFPNDLPYRFSFIYCFIVLVCAFKTFRHIKDYDYKTLILVGGVLILMVVFAQKFDMRYVGKTTVYASIAFIMAYVFIICAAISKKISKMMIPVVLTCAVVCEIMVCDVPRFGFGVQRSAYIADYTPYQKELEQIKAEEKDAFYRTELNDLPSALRMSPCWYNYEGINCFSSMANEKYALLQARLGNFSNKINSYMYHAQTPVYNMMFNIKYVVDNNNPLKLNEQYYTYLRGHKEGLTTYQNKYAASLGYAVNRSLLKNWDVTQVINRFELQNEYIRYATGIEEPVFKKQKIYTAGAENCSITEFRNDSDGHLNYSIFSEDKAASFDLSFTSEETTNYYLFVGSGYDFDNAIIKTADYTKTQEIDNEPYVLDLGVLKDGEDLDITLNIDVEESNNTTFIWLYSIDHDVFQKAYDQLCDDGLFQVEQKTDTYIKGSFTAKKDEVLYTSITADDGWKCYVDGVEVKPVYLNDALICLETGEGTHTVEFKFTPQGLKTGAVISGATLLALLLFYAIKKSIVYVIAKATDNMLGTK